jgi:hypothetical protein
MDSGAGSRAFRIETAVNAGIVGNSATLGRIANVPNTSEDSEFNRATDSPPDIARNRSHSSGSYTRMATPYRLYWAMDLSMQLHGLLGISQSMAQVSASGQTR